MAKTIETHRNAMTFCKAHLGKSCFAPLTGQDWSAWIAFVYTVEMYGRGDEHGRACALRAMTALVRAAQDKPDIRTLFAQSIAVVLDWSDIAAIWCQLDLPAATYVHGGAARSTVTRTDA